MVCDRAPAAMATASDILQTVAQMNEAYQAELTAATGAATIRDETNSWPIWRRCLSPAREAVRRYIDVEREAADSIRQRFRPKSRIFTKRRSRYELRMVTADGQAKTLAAGDVVRAFQPNRLSRCPRLSVYLSRWWEFLTDEPREANSEGGVVPAIWGTVVMTLIMSIAVVPFGVIAALYLREYAKSGPIVSVIRIAINNLAGVPSIVFGVFGLGFFCYIIGAYLDGGPQNAGFHPLPPARWYLLLGGAGDDRRCRVCMRPVRLQRTVGVAGIGEAIAGLCRDGRPGCWPRFCLSLSCSSRRSFGGFYEANLPNPYLG